LLLADLEDNTRAYREAAAAPVDIKAKMPTMWAGGR
jgi:hypothetical protein